MKSRRVWKALLALTLAAAPGTDLARAQTPAGEAGGQAPPVETGEGSKEKPSSERPEALLELRRTQPPYGQAGPVDPKTYVLGPGDLVQVDLWGRLIRSIPLEVSPEGKVFLPGLGPIEVAGRTLASVRERVLRLVAETFRGVHADLRLVRLRVFRAYVTGQVARAGAVDVNPVMRAADLMSQVGFAAGGSRRNITVQRRDSTSFRLDLQRFEVAGRMDLNPLLQDGDIIRVPAATEWVDIRGGVANPGRYELAPGDRLSTLVELSGGFLPSALANRALLVRFTAPAEQESLWLSLDELAQGVQDPELRDGDNFFVFMVSEYHVQPVAGIYGEIERPGHYPITLGRDRLGDLINWAGGFLPLADRSAIYLVRTPIATGGDPEVERLARLSRSDMTESEYAVLHTKLAEGKNSFRVDWVRIQREGRDIDPLLRHGDVVRVERLVTSVRVDGEVRRPGLVDFVPGRSLNQYIQLAGGYNDRASTRGVRVSRSHTGQVIPARSLKNVQPGDFIWVPEKRDVDAWGVFRDIVTVAGQVAVIVVALQR